MSSRVVVRQRGNLELVLAQAIENRRLSFLRHSLSQYRKYAKPASAKLSSSEIDCERKHVNRLHHWLCRSAAWRETVQERVPWVFSSADLGQNVLELGPGPGLTTDLLRPIVQRLTAIEVDHRLAESLGSRLRGSNVEVIAGDATAMPLPRRPVFRSCFVHHAASCALSGIAGQTASRGLAGLKARRSFRGQRQPAKLVRCD